MISAGAAEVVITPPIGVELAGYGPRLNRYSTDIHDHLLAQALVLDDGVQRIALITLDTMGFPAIFTDHVRQMIATRTNISPQNVMVAASHSHTSPPLGPTREWGMPDPAYVEITARHLVGAVSAAERKLRPVQLYSGMAQHEDLAWNRTGEPLVDTTVTALAVKDGDITLALLVHYACHPVMLGPRSEISADYPGAMRRYLASAYPGAVVLFANGACGDIDPVSNRDVWGKASFEDVDSAGVGLGQAVQQALRAAVPITEDRFRVQHGSLTLPYVLPSLTTVRAHIAEMEAEIGEDAEQPEAFEEVTGEVRLPGFWLRYWRDIEQRLLEHNLAEEQSTELQAIHVGDSLVIIAAPAEVYTEQGLAIKALSPGRQTMLVCYANDLVGYIPTARAFENRSYAATLAAAVYDRLPFQSDVAERLVASIRSMLV